MAGFYSVSRTKLEGNNVLFPVETAGTTVQGGIQTIEMVGGTNDEQTVVPFETVQLIEEEGSIAVVNEGVRVFKDQDARRHLPSLVKDHLQRSTTKTETLSSQLTP